MRTTGRQGDVMPTLPAHPDLDQLRHQAKDLLRAAKGGDRDARSRIEAVSAELTLAAAQLAIAREYGFLSWWKLKAEVEARTRALADTVEAFCQASVSGRPGRAVRMLAETPEIAGYSFATAVLLGDVDRVRVQLQRDASLATQPDPRTGWTPLHPVCASRLPPLQPRAGRRGGARGRGPPRAGGGGRPPGAPPRGAPPRRRHPPQKGAPRHRARRGAPPGNGPPPRRRGDLPGRVRPRPPRPPAAAP